MKTRLPGKSPSFASLLGHMVIPVITLLDFRPCWLICGSGFGALKSGLQGGNDGWEKNTRIARG